MTEICQCPKCGTPHLIISEKTALSLIKVAETITNKLSSGDVKLTIESKPNKARI